MSAVGADIMSRVTWFTGRARTWFTHLQPSDSPVNKLSAGSGKKFGGFAIFGYQKLTDVSIG